MVSVRLAHTLRSLACLGVMLLGGAGGVAADDGLTPSLVVARMQDAYGRISGYQAETEVAEYRHGELREKKEFLYSFRKPREFRLDMHSPHRGAVLVCCDSGGRIVVRPGGVASFLKMRLAPESRLLSGASGQRLDQADLGLLIANIGHSVGDTRRGDVTVRQEGERVVLETVADDHFLPGVVTRYRFFIDRRSWLPVSVVEMTPDGELKRVVTFRTLVPKSEFPAGFFDAG